MPETNVLYSVTAVVVVGLVAWVAFVLKSAKEPWARPLVPTPHEDDAAVSAESEAPKADDADKGDETEAADSDEAAEADKADDAKK